MKHGCVYVDDKTEHWELQTFYYNNLIDLSGTTLHQQAHKTWLWKGHNTLLTDGTTVLMSDTPENQRTFPQQANQKPGLGFPITRIVGLISLSVGSVIAYSIGPYQGKGSGGVLGSDSIDMLLCPMFSKMKDNK